MRQALGHGAASQPHPGQDAPGRMYRRTGQGQLKSDLPDCLQLRISILNGTCQPPRLKRLLGASDHPGVGTKAGTRKEAGRRAGLQLGAALGVRDREGKGGSQTYMEPGLRE